MKNIIFLFLTFFPVLTIAQLQISSINQGETLLDTKPRFGVDIGIPFNIIGPYSPIVDDLIYTETGLFVTNKGLSYIEGNDNFIHRTLGLNVPIRIGMILNKTIYLGVGNNFNFPFHYKLKRYDANTRENKSIVVSEFFSKRVSWFYPSLEFSAGISIHKIGRFSVRFQINYLSFFNPEFTEIVQGYEVKPYENIVVNRHWGLTFGYNPGL